MFNIHDQASTTATGDFSQAAQHTTEYYGGGVDDPFGLYNPNRTGNHPADFGDPIEDWKID